MEAVILMVEGYVRMTQWGRAVERPQLHAKHSTFPITLSHVPCPSPMSPSSNTHACTQNPHTHTPPVSGHSCFLTFSAVAGRNRRVRCNQFELSAWLNYFFIFENDNIDSVAIQSKWIFPFLDYMQSGISSLIIILFSHHCLLYPTSRLTFIIL